MTQYDKLWLALLSAQSDTSFAFTDLLKILMRLGFEMRIKGSHHIVYRQGVPEILNLQPNGALAKPYQVKQVRDLLVKYRLTLPEKSS
jgi:virulence-associated protein VapD